MSRKITIAIVAVSATLALATSAQAGNKGKPSGQSQQSQNHSISTKPWFGGAQQSQSQSSPNHSISTKPWFGGQQLGSMQQIATQVHNNVQSLHCKKDPLPLDPGRGDGKPSGSSQPPVITDPVQVTSGPYVWVNGHWERQKANQSQTGGPAMNIPTSVGPVVRDHTTTSTTTSNFNGIVRDHRTTTATTFGGFRGTIRDHRNDPSSANGGVTVSVNTSSPRNNQIPTLNGPGPLETLGNAASSIGSGLADVFSTEVGESSGPRDHRTNSTSNFGANVRDHRH